MKPLQGLQVVITRPETQAVKWQQQLQTLGAQTYLLPVMQIAALLDADQLLKIQLLSARLSDYQKIIFVSQNAVAYGQEYFKSLPSSLSVYAIGSATAKALSRWGFDVESASDTMNSEELLQLPSLQSVRGQKILICRGLGGRENLATTLRDRGAKVDYVELYQRRPHPRAADCLANMPWKQQKHSPKSYKQELSTAELSKQDKSQLNTVVSAHSGDSVQWLSELLQTDENSATLVKAWPLLVPGDRVNALAQQQGFIQTIVAQNASDAEMTQSLLNWWQAQR